MSRFRQILIAILVLSAAGIGVSLAADNNSQAMDTLSSYLHGRRLPLVEARLITKRDGERKLLLYGFVATAVGKADAEEQARDFMDDPDIEIDNRIKVRPELLTLGNNSNTGAAAEAVPKPVQDSQDASAENDRQQAAQLDIFPDAIQDREAYMNQGNDDELLTNNGLSGGIPLSLAIIGSGFVVPPFGAPIIAPPIYYNTLPPAVIRPPIAYSPPPVIVMRPPYTYNPSPVFRGFPSPLTTTTSPFAAGPSPMFPATGGAPPLTTTINPAFGGGFHSFSGFRGGFGRAFGGRGGFGGHR
jgi:hypothetical protein